MTQSCYLILNIMESDVWFFCVCEDVDKVLLRMPEGTGTTWKNWTYLRV